MAKERGNISEVARELGVHATVLRRWKKQHEEHEGQPFPGKGNVGDEEMAQLKRELRRVKEENEILTKAVGILTKRPG